MSFFFESFVRSLDLDFFSIRDPVFSVFSILKPLESPFFRERLCSKCSREGGRKDARALRKAKGARKEKHSLAQKKNENKTKNLASSSVQGHFQHPHRHRFVEDDRVAVIGQNNPLRRR